MTPAAAISPGLEALHAACAGVYDPEFGLSLVDLGLIYDVAFEGDLARIALTLTTPACPASGVIVEGVRAACAAVPGVAAVEVRLVWEPPWTPDMISARGRAELGWNGETP